MQDLHIRPLGDLVFVKRMEKEEEKTEGGIIIPDSAQKRSTQGTVIAVGPGKPLEDGGHLATGLNPGDEVFFARFSGTEITVNGDVYLFLRADEVFGVLEDVVPQESAK